MIRTATQLMVLLAVGLAGCGSSGEDEERVDRETVFDPLVDTLEQAEQVEDLALEQKRRLDDALQEIEGDDRKREE